MSAASEKACDVIHRVRCTRTQAEFDLSLICFPGQQGHVRMLGVQRVVHDRVRVLAQRPAVTEILNR